MTGKSISLVIPVFNEEAALADNFHVIVQHLDAVEDVSFEILIIDDGSTDKTEEVARGLCEKQENATLLAFSRNFGKEAAIQAGLEHTTGDAVIVMDSDLQHPPAMIDKMVTYWKEGAKIVEAYKLSRGRESYFSRILANSFYRIFAQLAGMDLRNHCDFKLLDREVVEAYKALPEHRRFFRGIIRWFGYPSVQIPFAVPERRGGSSAWTKLGLWRFSLGAISSFSAVPLHFVTLFGFLTLMISVIFGAIALYDWFSGQAVSGFTTVILLILIIGSIVMISIGLVGIYIARIYDEVKGRPSYILK